MRVADKSQVERVLLPLLKCTAYFFGFCFTLAFLSTLVGLASPYIERRSLPERSYINERYRFAYAPVARLDRAPTDNKNSPMTFPLQGAKLLAFFVNPDAPEKKEWLFVKDYPDGSEPDASKMRKSWRRESDGA